MTKIYRHLLQVEFFSPYRFQIPQNFDVEIGEPTELEVISEAITTGDCIGQVSQLVANEPVPASEVEGALQRIGNDGSFFNLDLDDAPAVS
jgi:hypothetical protein